MADSLSCLNKMRTITTNKKVCYRLGGRSCVGYNRLGCDAYCTPRGIREALSRIVFYHMSTGLGDKHEKIILRQANKVILVSGYDQLRVTREHASYKETLEEVSPQHFYF